MSSEFSKIFHTSEISQSGEINEISQSQKSNFADYIGSGGFGKVFEIKGTNMVKKEMNLRHEENLREICFLSTYKHVPFITQLQKCEIDEKNNTINMFMKNAGISLKELSKIMKIEERIKIVPVLLIQFARILIWMRTENILHCDIKPANICTDTELNITMIDWGFVQRFMTNKKYKIGTQVFYDPYTYSDKIDYKSEIFAFGITICYFILSGFDYDEWEDFCYDFDDENTSKFKTDPDMIYELNKKALNIINIEKTMQKFIDIHQTSKYYDLIIKMINIHPDNRLNMDELYDSFPLNLKIKYSLIECYTHIHNDENIATTQIPSNINEKILYMTFDWMISLKFSLSIKYSLLDAIKLLFLFFKKENTISDDIQSIATVCLYISTVINCENILNLDKCTILCNLNSKTEFLVLLKKVLIVLNYEVYPDKYNCEYNKKNEDIWRKTLLTPYINMKKCKFVLFSHNFFNILYYKKK